MPRDTKRDTFEQLFARLEERIGKLEQGGLPLEDSITIYEDGMQLARACQQRLDEAELKITKLRESFAPAVQRHGTTVREELADYEYVADDEAPGDGDEPFA